MFIFDRRFPAAAFALAALCVAGAPAGAQSSNCPGSTPEPHALGGFDFNTNSRVETLSAGDYKFGIVSCVANNDGTNPVYVHWLIPGPHGWAPPKETLNSAPRFSKDGRVEQFKGCLQY